MAHLLTDEQYEFLHSAANRVALEWNLGELVGGVAPETKGTLALLALCLKDEHTHWRSPEHKAGALILARRIMAQELVKAGEPRREKGEPDA